MPEKTLGQVTPEEWKRFNDGQLKVLRVLTYLTETRDDRKKGNKLAPEDIMFECWQKVYAEFLGKPVEEVFEKKNGKRTPKAQ